MGTTFDGLYKFNEDWYDEEDKYSLVGQDGNAFALMGYTARCMRECGLRDEVKEMQNRAMSGDYNNLICVCDEYVQRCNKIANGDMYEPYSNDTNDYRLLSRMKSDCDYYLNTSKHPKHLWAGDEQAQINKMKEIWNNLKEKPEWLSMGDINDYAQRMGVNESYKLRESKLNEDALDDCGVSTATIIDLSKNPNKQFFIKTPNGEQLLTGEDLLYYFDGYEKVKVGHIPGKPDTIISILGESFEPDEQPYTVIFSWDEGGPESGPIVRGGEDIVYAVSEEDACNKWEQSNVNENDIAYNGCWARLATSEEVEEWEREEEEAEKIDKWLRDNDPFYDEIDESYSNKDIMDALKWAYGFTNKKAKEFIKNTDKATLEEIVNGYHDNAKKSFLTDSYKLNEKKWNFTLRNGVALRNAIDDENYNEIVQSLYACYSELKDNNIIDEDDFYRYTGELDMYLNAGFDEDEDPEEILDYELSDFYDLCDNLNVWIPLTESLNESRKFYFGKEEAEKYGDMIEKALTGKTVSKSKAKAEEPGGLIYEANKLGIDMWDLLEALEGMCHQGRCREIDDSTYLVGNVMNEGCPSGIPYEPVFPTLKEVETMPVDELLTFWWNVNGMAGCWDMQMEPDEIDAYFKDNPDELRYDVIEILKAEGVTE